MGKRVNLQWLQYLNLACLYTARIQLFQVHDPILQSPISAPHSSSISLTKCCQIGARKQGLASKDASSIPYEVQLKYRVNCLYIYKIIAIKSL